jgi:hypothetical protein
MKTEVSEFHAYTDHEWTSIRDIIEQIDRGGDKQDADKCFVSRFSHHYDCQLFVPLRKALEDEGRSCLIYPQLWRSRDGEVKRTLIACAKQAQVLEKTLMNSEAILVGREADAYKAFIEFSQMLSRQIESISAKPSSARFNASKPHLTMYFERLFDVWCGIGGPSKRKLPKVFIQACAEPVVGTRSASLKAISKRMQIFAPNGQGNKPAFRKDFYFEERSLGFRPIGSTPA